MVEVKSIDFNTILTLLIVGGLCFTENMIKII